MRRGEPTALRRALRRPGFRRLFAAQTISRCGDTFNSVALIILVYRLTGSGVKVAGMVAFEIAPVLLFGFVAGSVVDRYPRRQVMISTDAARTAVALLLTFFHSTSSCTSPRSCCRRSAFSSTRPPPPFYHPSSTRTRSSVPTRLSGRRP